MSFSLGQDCVSLSLTLLRPLLLGFLLISSIRVPLFATATKHPTAPNATALHGTVNFLFGNKNGLVAVTDSQLSNSEGRPVALAPKLFRLDDRTICTIAGFYEEPGPQFGAEGYSASALISRIVDEWVQTHKGTEEWTVAEKARRLSYALEFQLAVVTKAISANVTHIGDSTKIRKPSASYVTVAGSEKGSIKVVQVRLEPKTDGPGYVYVHVPTIRTSICKNTFEVGNEVDCAMAGVTPIAESILSGTDQPSRRVDIVKKFLSSKVLGKTDTFSTDDLLALATYLKDRTSNGSIGHMLLKDIVGGPLQVAILTNGRVARFAQPEQPLTNLKAGRDFAIHLEPILDGIDQGNSPIPFSIGIVVGRDKAGAVVDGGRFTFVKQPLDNIIFTNSIFDRCTFFYSGSPMTIFASSNKVTRSTLYVGIQVPSDSPVLNHLKTDYPDLEILFAKRARH